MVPFKVKIIIMVHKVAYFDMENHYPVDVCS